MNNRFITETNDKEDTIMPRLSQLFDISQIKYKERDELNK